MKVRARPLLLAATLLAGALVPLAAPAAAETGPAPLGMSRLGRIVVDEAHARVFVSPGPGGSGVRVTDLGGQPVATVDGLPDANGMVLSADGRSLWVAVPSSGLVRLSTTTLAVEQRITLPTGHCAGDVAVSGSRLVYGHSCTMYLGSGGYGGVGVVDAATGASYGNITTGPFYKPVVATGPAGRVYAADAALSQTGLHLLEVSGPAPVVVASRASVCSNLRDLSASPDGSQVVTACGSPYEHTAYSAAELQPITQYPTGTYPVAGAWSGDGRVLAAGTDSAYSTDVSVHAAGSTTPRWVHDFGSSTALLQPRGLALSADGARAWAVVRGSSGGLDLHVLGTPAASASSIGLASDPPSFFVGEGTDIGGWLSWGGVGIGGVPLTVTRAATGAAPVPLPDVTTVANGAFTFLDSPSEPGSYTYTVSWAGDSTRGGVTATESVTVHSLGSSLELHVEPSWDDPSEVFGYVHLRYTGPDSAAGRTVLLTRQGGGVATDLPALTTDEYGGAQFKDVPPGGTVVYTATVDAYGSSPAATASATIATATPTTLTAQAPATATAGSTVTVQGVLTAPAGPVGGAKVSVTRSGCSSGSWSGTATTTPNGAWSVTDPNPPTGTCRYAASYAGSDEYAASTATASTAVSLRTTSLTASAPGTLEVGTPLPVSGVLTAGTAPLVGASITVLRTGCSPGDWSGTAVTGADGSWRAEDLTAPVGTCTYRASYAGDASHHKADSDLATTTVSLRTTTLTLTVTRGTGSGKKLVHVTGQLGAWHTNRTLTITAQPSGRPEVVLASGSVDADGNLTATYQPKTTTTYRVTYAGDAWYASATAIRTQ